MKYGMNMLLWTTDVDESHIGILEQLKSIGYDAASRPGSPSSVRPARP